MSTMDDFKDADVTNTEDHLENQSENDSISSMDSISDETRDSISQTDQSEGAQVKYFLDKNNLPETVTLKGRIIKNQIFIYNSMDPLTGKYVKKIFAKKITKLGREKWDMIWEYYRYRGKKSVLRTLKDNFGREVEFTYFGQPNQERLVVPKIYLREETKPKLTKEEKEQKTILREEKKKLKKERKKLREQKMLEKKQQKKLEIQQSKMAQIKRQNVAFKTNNDFKPYVKNKIIHESKPIYRSPVIYQNPISETAIEQTTTVTPITEAPNEQKSIPVTKQGRKRSKYVIKNTDKYDKNKERNKERAKLAKEQTKEQTTQ
jgi:hypothetical protein